MEDSQPVKLSIRLDPRIYAAVQKEALAEGQELGEYIQRFFLDHAIHLNLLDKASSTELQMKQRLVDRAKETARRICREGGFGPDITDKTIRVCMADKQWAADYEFFVRDNPYKNGNPRKGSINKEIGFRIREAIGGIVVKASDGKPAKVQVADSIIQSYTPMVSFDSDAVRGNS
jgi:hypothetical protein